MTHTDTHTHTHPAPYTVERKHCIHQVRGDEVTRLHWTELAGSSHGRVMLFIIYAAKRKKEDHFNSCVISLQSYIYCGWSLFCSEIISLCSRPVQRAFLFLNWRVTSLKLGSFLRSGKLVKIDFRAESRWRNLLKSFSFFYFLQWSCFDHDCKINPSCYCQ